METDSNIPKQKNPGEPFDFLLNDNTETNSKKSDDYFKIIQQAGFQIACEEKEKEDKLKKRIEELQNANQLKTDEISNLYLSAITKLEENIIVIKDKLSLLKIKEDEQEDKIKRSELKLSALMDEIDQIKKKLLEVRESFSISKQGLGQKMIADVEVELTNVFSLQKSIHRECQTLNEERYNVIKDSSRIIIEKLNATRAAYYERLKKIQEKIINLSENGITSRIAYILVWLGTVSAGVAGYFFAIFSQQANYSSQDALYFLLKNTLQTVYNINAPLYLKILYLILIIVVITAFSWLVDWLIKKKTYYSEKKGIDNHKFAYDLNISNMSYTVKVQNKTWVLLWLKIAPLALIVGIALIFLSQQDPAITNIDALSASTEGLLIGTAFAMGLASVIYLYVEKTIETRQQKFRSFGKNWEIGIAICLFIVIIFAFSFYRSPENFNGQFPKGIFSMIGFLSASFLTAFSFAYGMRYFGLLEAASSTEDRINQLDADIWRLSFPAQLQFDVNSYFENLSQLQRALLNNLLKKGQALGAVSKNAQIEPVDSLNSYPRQIKFPLVWKLGKKKLVNDESGLFELSEWEIEFFPEFSEKLKVIANFYNDKKLQLDQIKNELKQQKSDKEKIVQDNNNQSLELRKENERLTALQIKIKMKMMDAKTNLMREFEKEKIFLQDGFALGIMYIKEH